MLAYLSGCGVWTNNNDFFNRHFTPGSKGSDEPFVREPLMEAFLRFWTFIIILQVRTDSKIVCRPFSHFLVQRVHRMKCDFGLAFDKLNEVTWAWPKRELQEGCIRA